MNKKRSKNRNKKPGDVVVPRQVEIKWTENDSSDSESSVSKNVNQRKNGKMIYWFFLGMLFVFVYCIGCHADSIAKNFLFYPPRYSVDSPEATVEHDSRNEKYSSVSFQNSKGENLIGLYFACNRIALGQSAKGSILYCHGNGCNVLDVIDIASQLRRDLHCNVLVFDYAGYGRSEGRPTAKGILDDGRTARNWLAEHDGISKNDIIVYGQSLGGSVAVDIAAKDGARALIVESSFTSLGDMGRRMFPFLPVNWLLKERLSSVEKICNFRGPVFISHGKSDDVVPFSQGKRLFDAANEPKTFYVPPKDFDYHSAPHCSEHREKLKVFIDSLPPLEIETKNVQ